MPPETLGNPECPCLVQKLICFEKKSVDVDDDYGEVTLWTCRRCGRIWLHYFIEYEYLTAAGRMFTGVLSPAAAARVTAKDAVETFMVDAKA